MKKIVSLFVCILMFCFSFISAQTIDDDACPPIVQGAIGQVGTCIVFQLEIPPGKPVGDPDKSCDVIEEMIPNCIRPINVE
jgi:hypothetical protein